MPPPNRSDPGLGSGPPRYPGTFLLAFREAAAALKWTINRWLGGAVECLDAEGRDHVIGLENLYRRARRTDRAAWPELITNFLTLIDPEQSDSPPTSLADAADRLLPRLGRPLGRADGLELWLQEVPGTPLVLNLVIDYPQSMFYVTAALVQESGRPGGEWLEQALANLRARTPAECFEILHDESGLRQCTVGDAYDSSRALLLDGLLPETSAEGYFVAVPGRDELLVLPVTGPSLGYLPLLKSVAEQSFKTAPYAISDEVFWVQGGRWHLFPIELHGEKVTAQPPQEFLEILGRLAPDEEDEEGDEADESAE
jgi:hypothetical protein